MLVARLLFSLSAFGSLVVEERQYCGDDWILLLLIDSTY